MSARNPFTAARHTPGPWTVDVTQRVRQVRDGQGAVVAAFVRMEHDDCSPTPETDADAALIAAAPDLLAACEALRLLALDCSSRWSRGHPAIVERAEAAIAKARGTP